LPPLVCRDNRSGNVIACTRILTDDRAADAGGFYSSNEFEMGSLERLPGRSMESAAPASTPSSAAAL